MSSVGECPFPPDCAEGYRPIRFLSAGGFGAVYLALQIELSRTVVIKILHGDGLRSSQALERFQGEARVTSTLRHPNIITLLDHGAVTAPWIAYEYVAGKSLAQLLEDGPLEPGRACAIGSRIASALAAAHERGVFHRDIKPDNILIAEDETPKLIDFGIAKWTSGPGIQTEAGLIFGTPTHMAPELLRGEPASPASEIYALGVCLYEMVAGVNPFPGQTVAEILDGHLRRSPPALSRHRPGLPPSLEDLVMRCLAKVPGKRPPSAGELARMLEDPADGPESPDPQPRYPTRGSGPATATRAVAGSPAGMSASSPVLLGARGPARLVLAVTFIIGALLLLGWNRWHAGPPPSSPTEGGSRASLAASPTGAPSPATRRAGATMAALALQHELWADRVAEIDRRYEGLTGRLLRPVKGLKVLGAGSMIQPGLETHHELMVGARDLGGLIESADQDGFEGPLWLEFERVGRRLIELLDRAWRLEEHRKLSWTEADKLALVLGGGKGLFRRFAGHSLVARLAGREGGTRASIEVLIKLEEVLAGAPDPWVGSRQGILSRFFYLHDLRSRGAQALFSDKRIEGRLRSRMMEITGEFVGVALDPAGYTLMDAPVRGYLKWILESLAEFPSTGTGGPLSAAFLELAGELWAHLAYQFRTVDAEAVLSEVPRLRRHLEPIMPWPSIPPADPPLADPSTLPGDLGLLARALDGIAPPQGIEVRGTVPAGVVEAALHALAEARRRGPRARPLRPRIRRLIGAPDVYTIPALDALREVGLEPADLDLLTPHLETRDPGILVLAVWDIAALPREAIPARVVTRIGTLIEETRGGTRDNLVLARAWIGGVAPAEMEHLVRILSEVDRPESATATLLLRRSADSLPDPVRNLLSSLARDSDTVLVTLRAPGRDGTGPTDGADSSSAEPDPDDDPDKERTVEVTERANRAAFARGLPPPDDPSTGRLLAELLLSTSPHLRLEAAGEIRRLPRPGNRLLARAWQRVIDPDESLAVRRTLAPLLPLAHQRIRRRRDELAALLADPDPELVSAFLRALRTRPVVEAPIREAVEARAKGGDPGVRLEAAITLLGWSSSPLAREVLSDLTAASDPSISRRAAVRSRTLDTPINPDPGNDRPSMDRVERILERTDRADEAFDLLAGMLERRDMPEGVRSAILSGIPLLPAPRERLARLVERLVTTADPDRITDGLRLALEGRDALLVPVQHLARLARHPSPTVRREVMEVLGERLRQGPWANTDQTDALMAVIEAGIFHPDPAIAAAAIEAIRPRWVHKRPLLRDRIRSCIERFLLEQRSEDLILRMLEILDRPKTGDPTLPPSLLSHPSPRVRLGAALRSLQDPTVDPEAIRNLANRLLAEDLPAPVRATLLDRVAGLGRIPRTLIPGIEDCLAAPDPLVQRNALRALARGPVGLPPAHLAACLSSPWSMVRESALDLMDHLGAPDPDLVEPVSALLQDPRPSIQRRAGEVASRLHRCLESP